MCDLRFSPSALQLLTQSSAAERTQHEWLTNAAKRYPEARVCQDELILNPRTAPELALPLLSDLLKESPRG